MNNQSPQVAKIIQRIQESSSIFTLRVQFPDSQIQKSFSFQPGQFNMLYLYGIGEVAISIASDPDNREYLDHTIRSVGRVTRALATLQKDDFVGIRGPYGIGWPIQAALNKDVVIITGGLGCAPAVSIINYIIRRREQFGALKILQGIKHSSDYIFQQQYDQWQKIPNTEVIVTADQANSNWPWYEGRVTDQIAKLKLSPQKTIAMICGPEMMMQIAVRELLKKEVLEQNIYLSMERNMECGIGLCGHCQYGGLFICKEGPVLAYPKIKALFGVAGF